MLLVLRVDGKLPWNDLVWVLAETERVATSRAKRRAFESASRS
jgi:hypothetical protein